jgi:hypothetical protein
MNHLLGRLDDIHTSLAVIATVSLITMLTIGRWSAMFTTTNKAGKNRSASPVRMAIVTRGAVVLIILDFAEMLLIHFQLIVLMASDALKSFVIVRIHVAGRAGLPLVAMRSRVDREVLRVMIEGRRGPRIHRMTRRAIV